jgi:tetratricopeptide (TPR) repeat protein
MQTEMGLVSRSFSPVGRLSARAFLVACVLLSLACAPSIAVAAGGGGGGDFGGASGGSAAQRSSRSPESVAKRHHQAGLRQKQKAWKLEAKAAKADDVADREKLLAKAKKAYEKAIGSQEAALEALPTHYEAANELGYALRKTGRYAEAIASYDRALALNDVFYPAVEYRAEAYLATGQLERAKSGYMALFRNDRKLAAQLMTAMDEWLGQQPEGEAKASFAAWLEERKALAAVGEDLSQNNVRSW